MTGLKNGKLSRLGYIKGKGSRDHRDPLDPPSDYTTQMEHVSHGYADHFVIEESFSYFAVV